MTELKDVTKELDSALIDIGNTLRIVGNEASRRALYGLPHGGLGLAIDYL